MSIATDTEVFVVILFDRAARVLFGCSADEFFEFAKTRPFAGNLHSLVYQNLEVGFDICSIKERNLN